VPRSCAIRSRLRHTKSASDESGIVRAVHFVARGRKGIPAQAERQITTS
jgi:hypothetical protein